MVIKRKVGSVWRSLRSDNERQTLGTKYTSESFTESSFFFHRRLQPGRVEGGKRDSQTKEYRTYELNSVMKVFIKTK